MTFRLGADSKAKMAQGLAPDLVRCVNFAIEQTEQDFCVWEVARTRERQADLVAAKASRTLESHHIPDAAGVVHAIDIVPWIAGGPRWLEAPGLLVAKAMHRAVRKFDVPVTWGGVFDRLFASLDPTELDLEIEDYVARFRVHHGRKPLVDIWHFELPR